MTKKHLMALILGFVVLGLVVPPPVAAADNYSFKGKSVYALFADTDDSGCIETIAAVFASKQKIDTGSGETDGELAVLAVTQYDSCGSELLLSGYGESLSPNLEIPKDLKTATLKDTITVQDTVSSNPVDFKVDLEWESTSDKLQVDGDVELPLEGYTITLAIDGKFRIAQANGKVSHDDVDYAIGHSDLAAILKIDEGSLTIS